MVRNAIESDFRSSKLEKNSKNKKVVYLSEMARNATESDFLLSKMAASGHFVKI